MKKYKTVFFDLDHTLWDYDVNSKETLQELFNDNKLGLNKGFQFDHFHDAFQKVNLELWDSYDRGLIDRNIIRNDRFKLVLAEIGEVNDALAAALSDQYLTLSPTKKNLINNAIDVLNYLSERYPLYLITNGFESIQNTKVDSGGIRHYFEEVITSEKAGHKKPAKEIFEFVLEKAGFSSSEAVMVGDNLLTDIEGAKNAGVDTVLFNPHNTHTESEATYMINSLLELKNFL